MDNTANAEQVEPLISPAGCLLLVTSRQHFTVPGLEAKNLDTLSAGDACDLLLTIAPRIETQADEIAALCGHLPLALRLAATAMVKYKNLSPVACVATVFVCMIWRVCSRIHRENMGKGCGLARAINIWNAFLFH